MFQKPVVLTNSPCSLQGISYRQFKPLCLQFSNFKRLSLFPQQWKVVCMSPLYKKGSPSSITSYWPVKWILFYANISYKEWLIKLNSMPLIFYLQLNNLLVLARICLGKYETTLSSICHFTQRRGQWYFKLPATTNEQQWYSFFHRVPALANKVLPRVDIVLPNAKAKVLKLFWTFFSRKFNELLPCTWSVCDCKNCRLIRPNF